MIKKILIANRGEIALRIWRACTELNIPSVLVFSTADRESLPVRLAGEKVCIGPPSSLDSYLNIPALLSALEVTGCDAIHPGYGFLAENASFAEICEESGITFIGPTAENIRLMGDKAEARQNAVKAGLPILPGAVKPIKTREEARALARRIGFPVILKAAGGGGGRGMRIVRDQKDLLPMLEACQNEALAAFDNPEVYLEKFVERPRHIEVQILADNYGQVVALGERDCSLQRRHQKLVEEAPSPVVTARMRSRLCAYARRLVHHIGYRSAGTIEFLVDSRQNIYFMEMNTRIQVEHPVTETVTGVDIIKEQLHLANGERLAFSQRQVHIRGAAIECRINAEDPAVNFRPSPGTVNRLLVPGGPGVRFDSHLYQGYRVPPYYDSLIGKLIVSGRDRREALERLRRALMELEIDGVKTTVPLYRKLLDHAGFLSGKYYVGLIETMLEKEQSDESAAGQ
ncbi:MAG TPA: acetyl-CoA carboxylase biotin carboxylase subunit [bacterium]|uniref:Biotin carboxylase n=1 Tax=candidate division TA06 bacterium ADurb.Bin417 TaxID=1852828 RepID=A0A1V5MK70_UNCT6|nr:MAG: Biotin carboxylase [candidate division TA06 bacterium ADurb.Bin417]HNS49450.1 acetyl-CoA carboxylase biotin carboxylase subunit [bacterium]